MGLRGSDPAGAADLRIYARPIGIGQSPARPRCSGLADLAAEIVGV
jgi:hypothetical protein